MYPRETEANPGTFDTARVLGSEDAVRDDLRDFMQGLRPQTGALWVVFGGGSFLGGDFFLPPADAHLVEEIKEMGMAPVDLRGARMVVRFAHY
jgi:hypothetical protein